MRILKVCKIAVVFSYLLADSLYSISGSLDEKTIKKIVDEIQYGREVAGFAYKHSSVKKEKYIQEFPRMNDLIDLKIFKGKTGIHNDIETPCGFVAKNPENGVIIIAIRGTNGIFATADWFTNFKMYQLSSEHLTPVWEDEEDTIEKKLDKIQVDLSAPINNSKKVHAGFYRYAHSIIHPIWADLFQRLRDDFEKSRDQYFYKFLQKAKISLYGHSLGGAASQILALMIKNELLDQIEKFKKVEDHNDENNMNVIAETIKGNIKVFSYEAPRVFDPNLAKDFDDAIGVKNHIRIVQKSRLKYGGDFVFENASELLYKTQKSILSFFEGDTIDIEKSEWVVDPATLAPFGNFKETGLLCEIMIEKVEDRLKAGPVLHDMIPKITRTHIRGCLSSFLN